MRTIKRLLVVTISLIVVVVSVAGGAVYYVTRPLALPEVPFAFSIKQGASLKSAARLMQAAGALPNDWSLVWLARALGKTTQIKAGNYELESAVSMLDLLEILTKGQVSQGEISIIEGWTFSQFRAAMNDNPAIRHDSAQLSEAEILQRIGATETKAEGLFFPDTYYFANGVSDLVLLKRAYQTMQQHLRESWEDHASGLPFQSPYEALILASIVEKETGKEADRKMVAAVFTNRLHKGMMLQTDPAVIYGIGEKFDGNLRKRDLLKDTPYNTYTRAGLPPTPIALPGLASLQAVMHPAKSNALYFVARGDGSSEFSPTLAQHNRAVNRYQLRK
jgi:UPF0755 protein